ncbi:MFS general substrate transporter [Calocera cornea HHB12733]|uniref:MFS general substrate transporter n=1 Tax=Calocera cornea HHB12733 TaxID=1353952 RepID=A0A165DKU2_9BASI|nr:MFS general substrate transporter [Calocera cornea HHB12733]
MSNSLQSKDSFVEEKGAAEHREVVPAPRLAPLEEPIVIDFVAEHKLIRKIDRMLMPLLMTIYLFAFLDRSNLGNARLQGLPQDLLGGDPTGQLFAWLNAAFFFAFITLSYPGTILAKKFKQNRWMGIACIGWGVASVLQVVAFNFGGIFTCRFFVGAFEAMYAPNMALYFTLFYTRREIAKRLGIWFASFGVQHIRADGNLHPWKVLFLIEGLPSFVLGFITIWALPDRPDDSDRFTLEEKELVAKRMRRGQAPEAPRSLSWKHVRMAAIDWKIYVEGVVYFGLNVALSSLGGFLPTIIAGMGYSNATAQLLTVPPYAVGAVVLLCTVFLSDKYQNRGIPVATATAIGGTGYLILCVIDPAQLHVRYFCTFLICIGTYTTIPLTVCWFPFNMGEFFPVFQCLKNIHQTSGSESKRSCGIPIFQSLGQCGSILGSYIFPAAEGPRYIKGFALTCALFYLASISAAVLSSYFHFENKRRDRVYGKVDRLAEVDTSELADWSPNFRYTP